MAVVVQCLFLTVCLLAGHGSCQSMDQLINQAMVSSDSTGLDMDDSTVRIELDMLYDRDEWAEIDRLNQEEVEGNRVERKAIRNKRWTNKVIPYQLSNDFTRANLAQINAAMADWQRYTCIQFRQRTNDYNHILIQNGAGCSSYVGMNGGRQPVSLAPGCRQKGVIIHELGHAIGFHHEQTRPDRDRNVRILTHNIQRGVEYNFQRYSTSVINSMNVPYDYKSVMHYGQYAFSANGQRTIQTIDTSKQNVIGNRYGLSFRDIKLANLMYNCASQCSSKTCPGEGFVGKDCKCWCPGSPVQDCGGGGGGGGGGGSSNCTDQHVNCGSWAAMGECTSNPSYMLQYCKMSCESCDGGGETTCEDGNQYCGYWANSGHCMSGMYATYMQQNCKRSCNLCTSGTTVGGVNACEDGHQSCSSWASSGFCTSPLYVTYMRQNCKRSCSLCPGGR